MSKIMKELLDATELKTSTKWDRQTFLTKLSAAVQALEEDDWDKLTDPAQAWANEAQEAINKDTEVPEFKDAKAGKDDDEGDKTSSKKGDKEEPEKEEEAEEKSSKPSRKGDKEKDTKEKDTKKTDKKDTKKTEAKSEKKDDKKVGRGRKGSGTQQMIKKLVLKKPKMSIEDIQEALKAKGHDGVKASTISTIRTGFRDSIKVIQDAGYLKEIEL